MTPQLPAAPTVTGVVARAGSFESTVSTDRISVRAIGIRGGRNPLFDLTLSEATEVLALIEHGRRSLIQMGEQDA